MVYRDRKKVRQTVGERHVDAVDPGTSGEGIVCTEGLVGGASPRDWL
jgi:hypothetical protein